MVKLKVCGLTRAPDISLAMELGADYLGFVFHRPSPRYVDPASLAAILRNVPGGKSRRIGVFVDESVEKIREIKKLCGLDSVQLHGSESPEFCQKLGLPFWKALRPRNPGDLFLLDLYPGQIILLDTWDGNRPGGTGRPIDPELLKAARQKSNNLVLAGGVNRENLSFFLSLEPYALDVNSSLEEAPGRKNHAAMKAFFKTLTAQQARNTE